MDHDLGIDLDAIYSVIENSDVFIIRFNLIDNNIVRHNLTLYREIDCWELFVDWTPNGYAKGLYFRLNLKSDMLQDLKVEQKTGIYTTRPSF